VTGTVTSPARAAYSSAIAAALPPA